ncbi:ComEC/Rec2 family competence protein [Dactylosporangium sp. CS-033363]|uniref:ComEC/Rec2 family competence protein n=1 Tax=Dactylosporangium sp. CS-033363 TaxID=3239935 RepID=UPI003D8C727C
MYQVDFLPVENDQQDGGKSGDAIAMKFSVDATGREAVVVIDGGFTDIGDDLVEHIKRYYGTSTVDLVISTHPDMDHLNGLTKVLEQLYVGELLIHQPRRHVFDVSDFSNLENLDNLIALAKRRGVTLTEPFTGLVRFDGQLRILGPTEDFYEQHLREQLAKEKAGAFSASAQATWLQRASRLAERALASLPFETLTDDGETTPRNNSSVITLVTASQQRMLFTGDAGIPALGPAAAEYESTVGSFLWNPLSLFQAPHHGSKRNVGPTILDRILGERGAPYSPACAAYVSSAKAAIKHPSPKVVNALKRRGCGVWATEGNAVMHADVVRPGWNVATQFPTFAEDDDD